LMHPSPYGLSGPGLNGPHLDYLGWLPMDRTVYFGRDGRNNYTLRFSSMSVPHKRTMGWLLALIPYDRDDPANVYTVEFRTPTNFDSGLKQAAVVIHRIQRVGSSYYSMIVTHSHEYYELLEGTEWVNFLGFDSENKYQYIRIRVERINRRAHYADVRIISTFNPVACRSFEQKKLLGDQEQRSPDLDVQYICVPRSHSNEDDFLMQKQRKRNRFYEDLQTYGMNACADSKVWRAIDQYDYVCVDQQRVSTIQEDNELDEFRRTTDNDCMSPFVSRGAFIGDEVCVSEEERQQIKLENAMQHSAMRYYAFFNGQDSVGA
uniref:PKD_channel domain-containing protein n=1 Tax=Anisakis simplex TaxID=6269 RepID=A0A0M3IYN9_ANISI